jgi:hypothetical protein
MQHVLRCFQCVHAAAETNLAAIANHTLQLQARTLSPAAAQRTWTSATPYVEQKTSELDVMHSRQHSAPRPQTVL